VAEPDPIWTHRRAFLLVHIVDANHQFMEGPHRSLPP
jgi:hypothetical protein